jgi:hypothetical protein
MDTIYNDKQYYLEQIYRLYPYINNKKLRQELEYTFYHLYWLNSIEESPTDESIKKLIFKTKVLSTLYNNHVEDDILLFNTVFDVATRCGDTIFLKYKYATVKINTKWHLVQLYKCYYWHVHVASISRLNRYLDLYYILDNLNIRIPDDIQDYFTSKYKLHDIRSQEYNPDNIIETDYAKRIFTDENRFELQIKKYAESRIIESDIFQKDILFIINEYNKSIVYEIYNE